MLAAEVASDMTGNLVQSPTPGVTAGTIWAQFCPVGVETAVA